MSLNVEELRKHVDSEWCQIEPFGVRAFAGEDAMYVGDIFVTGSFKKGTRQTAEVVKVTCVAAADLPACDLLKIDTEGCEVEILKNMDLRNIQVVMLEHHTLSDADIIKNLLLKDFDIIHDESDRKVGTDIFVKKTA